MVDGIFVRLLVSSGIYSVVTELLACHDLHIFDGSNDYVNYVQFPAQIRPFVHKNTICPLLRRVRKYVGPHPVPRVYV